MARAQAAKCVAAGDALGLAPMLRRKQSAAMRKAHLFALARHWGYRSDAWRQKGDGCRKRRRAVDAAAAAGALQLALPPPVATAPVPLDDAGVRVLVSEQFGALLASSVRSHAGGAARAAMEEQGVAAFTSNCLTEYAFIVRMMRTAARSWRAALAQQRVWSAAAVAAAASPTARERGSTAWALLPFLGADSPAECGLDFMKRKFVAAHRLWVAQSTHAGAALALHSSTHPLPVALREYEGAVLDGLHFVTQAALLLARLRAEAPLRTYALAAELLVEECARFCDGSADAYVQRATWSADAMQRGIPCQAEPPRTCSATLLFERTVAEAEILATVNGAAPAA